ncbi:MAG: hypothetical protein HC840_01680 [Leptolyngbyaceae cyanobacterium RM2_2_4]|nr:hypothetical protein [Leptolyngbyaceae cyanobacterium RM2_2_4]
MGCDLPLQLASLEIELSRSLQKLLTEQRYLPDIFIYPISLGTVFKQFLQAISSGVWLTLH